MAVFPLPPIVGLIAAPVAVTVFLGVDGGVEHPTAAAADKFVDGVSSGGKARFLIRFFQIILIVLLPSGGVFRLAFARSSPGIPCRRSCGFQGSALDLAIKKSPHNNLNLTIPSGMALVRVRYVAIKS